MYLERLEIQGFKSFAKKTSLTFAHDSNKADSGLTAIVGPNGSGKSNIADAVRWVLGEQSVKLLRGKRSEDVIFSGSRKKSSLSFAEVSLYLNNEDKKAPVDYAQLVVTRRLYRDGESEYLINGGRARLTDMQLLLAKARFGQRAYSVVGQGMVENFLNTTPAERKEFFDEATGVKMYHIKKHDAELKLNNAQNNLTQAETLLSEIEPRMKSLTRQIKKLERRAEIEAELQQLQTDYYAGLWHELRGALEAVNKQVARREETQRGLAKDLQKINSELNERGRESYDETARAELAGRQQRLRARRDDITQQLAEVRARRDVGLAVAGKNDEMWLRKKSEELERAIARLEEELREAQAKETDANKRVVALRREQQQVDERIVSLRRDIIEFHSGGSHDAHGAVAKIREVLADIFRLHDEIDVGIANNESTAFFKGKFGALRKKIERIKDVAEQRQVRDDADLEKINSEIITLEEQKSELTDSYVAAQSEVNATVSVIAKTKQELDGRSSERDEVRAKLSAQTITQRADDGVLAKQEKEFVAKVAAIDDDLAAAAKKLEEHYEEERKRRDAISALQKKAHGMQNDYNTASGELGEAQVEKARIETKLEDLEQEVRRTAVGLRVVMEHRHGGKRSRSEAQAEIQRLQRQLEQIGGIDPEVQKEYVETRERYDFLQRQTVDLQAGTTALYKAIAALEKTIQERFDKSFSEIAKQFERYFKVLFDGGTVRLEKIMEEENKIFTGIDVMACPPHKKIKHITTLSGGERALTAIALIAAIIAVNPSPFVLLDEVDAALDEANSTRLAKILEDLSKKTQFIAITHNRTIMYKADIIYGVTMGDDGVSKLLSVKVEDVNGARR